MVAHELGMLLLGVRTGPSGSSMHQLLFFYLLLNDCKDIIIY
jgi:hypothetical protein